MDETVLIDRMTQYTTSLAWMCAKANLRNISQDGKAVDNKPPTSEEVDTKGGLSKDCKSFLEEADQVCQEDPEDPERQVMALVAVAAC